MFINCNFLFNSFSILRNSFYSFIWPNLYYNLFSYFLTIKCYYSFYSLSTIFIFKCFLHLNFFCSHINFFLAFNFLSFFIYISIFSYLNFITKFIIIYSFSFIFILFHHYTRSSTICMYCNFIYFFT